MTSRRLAWVVSAAVGAVVVGAGSTALANNLRATANAVGTAISSVSPCGSLSNLTFTYTVSSGSVTQVAVGGIPPSCQNGTATLYLGLQTSTSVEYQSSASISSSSITFNPSPSVAIASIASVDVAVVGK